MADLNSVSIVGNVTNDPEENSGETWNYARFGIAVEGRKEDEVHFFNVVVWGQSADFAMRNVHKGRRIAVGGRLEQSRWVDEQSGDNRSRVELVAEDVYLLGPRKDGAGDTGQGADRAAK